MKKTVLSIAILALTLGAFAQTNMNLSLKPFLHLDKEYGQKTEA
jgi:hypothetical protein